MSNRKLAEEIEALAGKATKGAWKVTGGVGVEGQPSSATDYDPLVIGGFKGGRGPIHFPSYGIYSEPSRKEGEANASLIVALVNNLPAILSALRAEPDEAARERIKTAVEEGLHYGLPQVDASLVPADLADSITRAAIAAMQEPRDG